MTANQLRQPPFANQINRDDDLVMIYCGRRAWELAMPDEDRVPSLVLPSGKDAAEFTWPVQGKQVLVLAQDEIDSIVDLLAVELLRAGAEVVHIRYADNRPLLSYDRTAPRQSTP